MTIKTQSGRILGAYALALQIGFLWTDIRSLFPWFEALVEKFAGG